jgi:hypothetical protein
MPNPWFWKRLRCPKCRGYLKPCRNRKGGVWFKCRHCEFESKRYVYVIDENLKSVSQADIDDEWLKMKECVSKIKAEDIYTAKAERKHRTAKRQKTKVG